MKRLSATCMAALSPALALAGINPTGPTVDGSGPYVWTYSLQLSARRGKSRRQTL